MEPTTKEPKQVLKFKQPGAALDISNNTTGLYADHVAWLKQWGALVFDAGKSTAWLENKLVNADLFDYGVQIHETSARCLRLEGHAIVDGKGRQYHKVVASVCIPKDL